MRDSDIESKTENPEIKVKKKTKNSLKNLKEDIKESPSPLTENEIFKPEEGWVNTAAKYYNPEKIIEPYQRVLAAPANAFESLIRFGMNIVNGKAATDITSLISNIKDKKSRDYLFKIIKKGWENCNKTEKAAFVTELVCGILIAGGGISKLKKAIPPEKLLTLQKFAVTRQASNIATAIVASPADELTAVMGPTIAQTIGIKKKSKKKSSK